MDFKIMIKAIIGIVISSWVLCGSCAFAHSLNSVKFNTETQALTIEGNAVIDNNRALSDVTIQVLKQGKMFDGNITPQNYNDYFQNIVQVPVDENGNYHYTYSFASIPGVHRVKVVFADGTYKLGEFVYSSKVDTDMFLKEVNQSNTINKMKDIFSKYYYIVDDFTVDDAIAAKYPDIDVAGKIAEGLIGITYTSMDNFADGYKAQTVVAGVNLANSKEEIQKMIEDYYSLIQLTNNKVYNEIYLKMPQIAKDPVCDSLLKKNFNSNSFKDTFCQNSLFFAVKEAGNWKEVAPIIQSGADYINLEKYNKLSQEEQIFVDKKLINSDADSFSALLEEFKRAVDKPYEEQTSNGGGSGGGGNSTKTTGYLDNVPTLPQKEKFTDLAGVPWAYDAISYLAEKGIVNGKTDGIFDPNGNITREEFVKMIVCAFALQDNKAECNFKDVITSDWYYSYVASAYAKGIIKGVRQDYFGTNDYITREDIVAISYRIISDILHKVIDMEKRADFNDVNNISDYAVDGVYAMNNLSIVNGKEEGLFAPKDYATRAETAKIIYGLLESEVLK